MGVSNLIATANIFISIASFVISYPASYHIITVYSKQEKRKARLHITKHRKLAIVST